MGLLQERFRHNLAAQLEAQGVSESELARRMGVSSKYVCQCLSKPVSIGLHTLEHFAASLGVEPHVLLQPTAVEKSSDGGNVADMEEVLTVTEAAAVAKLSTEEIRRKCRLGIIPATEKESAWLISKADLLRFLQAPPRRGRPRKHAVVG